MTGESRKQLLRTSATEAQGLSRGIAGCSDRGQELCGWAASLWKWLWWFLTFTRQKTSQQQRQPTASWTVWAGAQPKAVIITLCSAPFAQYPAQWQWDNGTEEPVRWRPDKVVILQLSFKCLCDFPKSINIYHNTTHKSIDLPKYKYLCASNLRLW